MILRALRRWYWWYWTPTPVFLSERWLHELRQRDREVRG